MPATLPRGARRAQADAARHGRPRRGPDPPRRCARSSSATTRWRATSSTRDREVNALRHRDRREVRGAARAAPARGRRPALHHHRDEDRHRPRAHRRPGGEHRPARARAEPASRSSSPTSTCRAWPSRRRRWCKESLDAFVARDTALRAARLRRGRRRSTPSTHQIFRELLTFMMEDPRTIPRAIR